MNVIEYKLSLAIAEYITTLNMDMLIRRLVDLDSEVHCNAKIYNKRGSIKDLADGSNFESIKRYIDMVAIRHELVHLIKFIKNAVISGKTFNDFSDYSILKFRHKYLCKRFLWL